MPLLAVLLLATTSPILARLAPPPDLLAGPKVAAPTADSAAKRPTLVTRGFDGEIIRLGPEPGVDALRALVNAGGEWALDEAELRAIDAVANARAGALDTLLRENYELLFSLQGLGARANSATIAGRAAALLELGSAMRRFTPYFERGGFLDEFARLPGVRATTVEQAKALEKRYIDALVRTELRRVNEQRDKLGAAKNDGEFGIRVKLRLEHFGALIKEAIERKVALGEAEFQEFAQKLNLDGTTQEKVKAELTPLFLADLAGKSTPAMRMEVFTKVYAMLTPDQRRALLAHLAERKVPTPPPTPERSLPNDEMAPSSQPTDTP